MSDVNDIDITQEDLLNSYDSSSVDDDFDDDDFDTDGFADDDTAGASPVFEEGSDAMTTKVNLDGSETILSSGEADTDARELNEAEPLQRQEETTPDSDQQEQDSEENASEEDTSDTESKEETPDSSESTEESNNSEKDETSPVPAVNTLLGINTRPRPVFTHLKEANLPNRLKETDKSSTSESSKTQGDAVTENEKEAQKRFEEEYNNPILCPYCGNELYSEKQSDGVIFYLHLEGGCHRIFSSTEEIEHIRERLEEEQKQLLKNRETYEAAKKKETTDNAGTSPQESKDSMENGNLNGTTGTPTSPMQESSTQSTPVNSNASMTTANDSNNHLDENSEGGSKDGTPTTEGSTDTNGTPTSTQKSSHPESSPSQTSEANNTVPGNNAVMVADNPISTLLALLQSQASGATGQKATTLPASLSSGEVIMIYTLLKSENDKMLQKIESLEKSITALQEHPQITLEDMQKTIQDTVKSLPEIEKIGKLQEDALKLDAEKASLNENIQALTESREKMDASVIRAEELWSQYVSSVKPLEKLHTKLSELLPKFDEYLKQINNQYMNIAKESETRAIKIANNFVDNSNKFIKEAKDKGFLSKPKQPSTIDKLYDYLIPSAIAFAFMFIIVLLTK